MNSLLKNTVAAIADFTLFFILWWVFSINWMLAFFLSTLIVIAVWWLLEWGLGWENYLFKR